MQAYLVKTFIGIFALDEKRKIISFKPFPKDPRTVATKLMEEEPDELMELKNEFKNSLTADREIENFVKQNLRRYAIEYKFVTDPIEFNQFLTKANSELSKLKIRSSGTRDSLVIHTNNTIEELDKTINIFIERLREWYSIHFPEMDRMIENHEKFARLIETFGDRKNINEKSLDQLKERSTGTDFTEDDINAVKLFASNIVKLYEFREALSKYLNSLLREVAPNFVSLAGDVIAAKLIAKAGGLERLSRMPSSTIQLLGSEKALFRFLKSHGRSKSPKYGLIFNHPLIQNAPANKQGKIARLLASKLSIASRIDYYSKTYSGDQMKKDLEMKVKHLLSSKK